MDLAYDHIQEESFPKDPEDTPSSGDKKPEQQTSLNSELQDAYRAFSSSPWGARIGGFFGTVVKQGESVYREAQQELTAVGQDATRGFTDLRASIINRTRSLSLTTSPPAPGTTSSNQAAKEGGDNTTPTTSKDISSEDAIKESETVLSRLRGEATKRLKDLQKAEDAADEALLRFGSNLRDFLRDAIKIAPPTGGSDNQSSAVMFESKDAHGKRVIHTSRFDAQLHVIHTSTDSFTKNTEDQEYLDWSKGFDIDKKTEDISSDLNKYPELRTTMEKLVPDQVPYADFWKRYYFLRHGIETAEARRRDLLKAASAEEEVGWDDDSEDENSEDEDSEDEGSEDEGSEDEEDAPSKTVTKLDRPASRESSSTIHPPTAAQGLLKPSEPRKSNDEKSQADSEASYDVVGARSGVPSQAPNSPKESGKSDDDDDSEEEDWE
ncbi:BSD domain-containing protein 1-B [Diplogelasinospora grovesii]|uniref:BSD domain-containing protein 1-B n=1 Tax=Diplogelasinospora grovesii TaxID=303347 RepID=A0AAN6NDA8_9PEZI|nr:BSD domain-containing protein 1-B [Diplogelasinospora grovesii]